MGTFLLGAILGVAIYSISGGIGRAPLGLLDGLLSLAFGSILSAVIINKASMDEVLTLKRTLALVIVGMFLLGTGLIVSSILANLFADPYLLEKGYFVSCATLTAYFFIILAVMSNKKGFKLLLLVVIQPITVILLHTFTLYITNNYYLLTINYFFIFIIIIFTSLLFSWWYFTSIANVGKALLGYNSILILQAFIDALVLDKTGLLEVILKSMAEESDVEIRTFRFGSENQNGTVIVPFFHPGPFKDIGSSKLPTRIAVEFLKQGVFPVVFHSPTTHDKDLILKNDCERVMETIFTDDMSPGSSKAYPMVIGKSGNITVTAQIFDETPLVVISRAPLSTEDLPENINTLCMEKLAEMGYSDGAIVDAHNSMVANVTELTEEDAKDIDNALGKAMDIAKGVGQGILTVGFSNTRLDSYSIKEGIGEAGIMTMVTEVNGLKGAFVSVDGNNMVVGLRDKIKEALKEIGYECAEITTTDTHVVTGHTMGEGYFPLGKAIPETVLLEKIVKAVVEADSRKAECSVKFSKRKVESVYLLGNRGIENLWRVTHDTMKVARRRLVVLLFLLIFTGAFLYYIA
jgi:putative membrane protein